MTGSGERRRSTRIRFYWPIWFGYDEIGELRQGKVIDLSQEAVSFMVAEERCPGLGSHVVTSFSFPYNDEEEYGIGRYRHWSEVIRVERVGCGRCRVAMRLHEPLAHDFRPLESSGLMAMPV